VAGPPLKSFMDAVAAVIKGIDPLHLVGTGAQAEYTPGMTDFAGVHAGPNVDAGSLHDYDEGMVVSTHLAPTLSALTGDGKPFIVGEVGITSGAGCPTSLDARAAGLRQKLDAAFLSGVAGVLVWNYSPNPGTGCGYSVRAAQPATGTPADPTIGMIAGYAPPAPAAPPVATGRLVARSSGRCLDVTGASTANGVALEQWDCVGQANQRFRFQPTDGGFYELVAQHSGKCVDVAALSLANGARVQQWDCWGGQNQQFRLLPVGGGAYEVIARHSIRCLDVMYRSLAAGALIQQYDCRPQTNQQFMIQT
jgi:ricin-type beta-trefoil lectin protein